MMYLPASSTRITGVPRSWETGGMVLPPESPERTSPTHTKSQTPCPQIWGRPDFCCVGLPVCGALLWQHRALMCQCVQALRAHQVPSVGGLTKHMKCPPSLRLRFLLFTSLSLPFGHFTFLFPIPAHFTLEFRSVDFKAKDIWEIIILQGCKLKFQTSTESLEKEFSHPEMPSPSSSLEPPHFTITPR